MSLGLAKHLRTGADCPSGGMKRAHNKGKWQAEQLEAGAEGGADNGQPLSLGCGPAAFPGQSFVLPLAEGRRAGLSQ